MADEHERAPGFQFFEANPHLLRPLFEPMRMRIYIASLHGPVSTKELAELFEQPIQRVSYHVRTLVEAGLLRVVRQTRRRGAVETHYEGIADLDVDDETLRRLPVEAQQGWFTSAVKGMADDTVRAIEEGGHAEPDLF